MNPQRMKKLTTYSMLNLQKNEFLYATTILAVIIDKFQTYYGLTHGFSEVNPVLGGILPMYGIVGSLLFATLVQFGSISFMYWRGGTTALYVTLAIGASVVITNGFVLFMYA